MCLVGAMPNMQRLNSPHVHPVAFSETAIFQDFPGRTVTPYKCLFSHLFLMIRDIFIIKANICLQAFPVN